MLTARFAAEIKIEDGSEIGRVVDGLLNHRQRVLRSRVLVAGLRRGLQLVDGLVHFLNTSIED